MFSFPTGAAVPIPNIKVATTTPAANTTCTITLAAVTTAPNARHVIQNIQWSYGTTTAPTGGRLFVVDGTTQILNLAITAAGPGGYNLVLPGTPGNAVTVTLAAGGSNVQGYLNVQSAQVFD